MKSKTDRKVIYENHIVIGTATINLSSKIQMYDFGKYECVWGWQ